MTYVCPRPTCTETSEVLTYCRHDMPADLAAGDWMVEENDLAVISPQAGKRSAAANEIEEATTALLTYIAKDHREWIHAGELRIKGAPGKSAIAVDCAYKQLIDRGELHRGPSNFVRIAKAVI